MLEVYGSPSHKQGNDNPASGKHSMLNDVDEVKLYIKKSILNSIKMKALAQCCFFQNLVTIHFMPKPSFCILSPPLVPLDFLTLKK